MPATGSEGGVQYTACGERVAQKVKNK